MEEETQPRSGSQIPSDEEAITESHSKGATGGEVRNNTVYHPRAQHPTPMLERFGRDLCREALEERLPTVLGRELELQAVMETLCRWTKRNPLLIAPAGVGKTAIVEALAQRIVAGDVAPPLEGIRLFSLQISMLLREVGVAGETEKRVQALLEEAGQDGIILFIDEIQAVVGAGTAGQLSGSAALLKSAIARGDIICIGATTDAKFPAFIDHDRALARRFQPLRIQELSADATLDILNSLCQRAVQDHQITVTDQALRLITVLAQKYLRNRKFPDKAIDIFEQCVAHALINKIREVTPSIVQTVVERMVGIPVDLGPGLSQRLATVKERLVAEAFCPETIADRVVSQLEITMRGLDVSPVRPNVVLFAAGEQSEEAELTAKVLAEALFGSQERLIEVDMTRFSQPADVNWLTGSPPGYTGHKQPLPFHLELAQKPWSVLHFKNVENSHALADEILAQAFHDGYFTDAQGRRVYLSDVVVVLTAAGLAKPAVPGPSLGFKLGEGEDIPQVKEEGEESAIARLVAKDLWKEVDIAWAVEQPTEERIRLWVEQRVLPPIAERYQDQGLEIEWGAPIIEMLTASIIHEGDLLQGKRALEEKVLPSVVSYLGEAQKILITCDDNGNVQFESKKEG